MSAPLVYTMHADGGRNFLTQERVPIVHTGWVPSEYAHSAVLHDDMILSSSAIIRLFLYNLIGRGSSASFGGWHCSC